MNTLASLSSSDVSFIYQSAKKRNSFLPFWIGWQKKGISYLHGPHEGSWLRIFCYDLVPVPNEKIDFFKGYLFQEILCSYICGLQTHSRHLAAVKVVREPVPVDDGRAWKLILSSHGLIRIWTKISLKFENIFLATLSARCIYYIFLVPPSCAEAETVAASSAARTQDILDRGRLTGLTLLLTQSLRLHLTTFAVCRVPVNLISVLRYADSLYLDSSFVAAEIKHGAKYWRQVLCSQADPKLGAYKASVRTEGTRYDQNIQSISIYFDSTTLHIAMQENE